METAPFNNSLYDCKGPITGAYTDHNNVSFLYIHSTMPSSRLLTTFAWRQNNQSQTFIVLFLFRRMQSFDRTEKHKNLLMEGITNYPSVRNQLIKGSFHLTSFALNKNEEIFHIVNEAISGIPEIQLKCKFLLYSYAKLYGNLKEHS